MVGVKRMTDQFALEDTFNFDETTLFWKMTPDKGLSHAQIPGTKCLPILLIGTVGRPLLLRVLG
jgi:hypothetical protein